MYFRPFLDDEQRCASYSITLHVSREVTVIGPHFDRYEYLGPAGDQI